MNSNAHFPKDGEDVAERSLAVKVAIMATNGANRHAISKELQISDKKVRSILSSDECIAAMQQLTNEALAAAKSRIRIETAKFTDKILKVIDHHLEKNNLNAVYHALNILGMLNKEEQTVKADNKIVVVMPGAQNPLQEDNKPDIVVVEQGDKE